MNEEKQTGDKRENRREDEKKERLIIEGNAFYELDLECLRQKEQAGRFRQKGQRK